MNAYSDCPDEGYYKTRLVRRGVLVPIRFWFIDGIRCPETNELLSDQVWHAEFLGRAADPFKLWARYIAVVDERGYDMLAPAQQRSALYRTTKADYDFMIRDREWALEWAPDDPVARPREPVDLTKVKPLFS